MNQKLVGLTKSVAKTASELCSQESQLIAVFTKPVSSLQDSWVNLLLIEKLNPTTDKDQFQLGERSLKAQALPHVTFSSTWMKTYNKYLGTFQEA